MRAISPVIAATPTLSRASRQIKNLIREAQISAAVIAVTTGGFSEFLTCDCTGAESGVETVSEIGPDAMGAEIGFDSTGTSAIGVGAIGGGGRVDTPTRPSIRQALLACSVLGQYSSRSCCIGAP